MTGPWGVGGIGAGGISCTNYGYPCINFNIQQMEGWKKEYCTSGIKYTVNISYQWTSGQIMQLNMYFNFMHGNTV